MKAITTTRPRRLPASVIAPLLLLLVTLMPPAVGAPIAAQSIATVRPDPAILELGRGETRTVEILLANARDVYGIDVRGAFDPAILEVVDADPTMTGVQMIPGIFPQPDFMALNAADNAAGTIRYVVTQVNPTSPATGDGLIFSFQVLGRVSGTTELEITLVEMSDRDGNLLAVATESATVRVTGTIAATTGVPIQLTSESPGETAVAPTDLPPSPTTAASAPATAAPPPTIDAGQAGGPTLIATLAPTTNSASVSEPVTASPDTAPPAAGTSTSPLTTPATNESSVPPLVGESPAVQPLGIGNANAPSTAAPVNELARAPTNAPQVIGGASSPEGSGMPAVQSAVGTEGRSGLYLAIGGLIVLIGMAGFLYLRMRKRS